MLYSHALTCCPSRLNFQQAAQSTTKNESLLSLFCAMQSEFRTSRICCLCHGVLQPAYALRTVEVVPGRYEQVRRPVEFLVAGVVVGTGVVWEWQQVVREVHTQFLTRAEALAAGQPAQALRGALATLNCMYQIDTPMQVYSTAQVAVGSSTVTGTLHTTSASSTPGLCFCSGTCRGLLTVGHRWSSCSSKCRMWEAMLFDSSL